VAHQQGGEIRLSRSNGYWGKRSDFESVSFLPVKDPVERLAKVNRGEADIAYDVPPALASGPGPSRILRRPGVTLYYLGLDLRGGNSNPLRRKDVRLALHTAIDRERLVQEAQHGMAAAANQTAPSSIFGFNPKLVAPAPDPVRAQALLKQAGFPEGFALTIDAAREVLPAAQHVAADLQAVGLQAAVREGARHEVWDRAQQGRSQAFLVGWSFTSGESSEFFEYCLHTPTSSYGFFNYGHYSNPKIDAVAEENAAILDPTDRQRRLQEATTLVMEELPVLPLYVADDVYAVREGISFLPRPDGEIWLPDVRDSR
jgi:peptide/nickel transport system substrate-binding protein